MDGVSDRVAPVAGRPPVGDAGLDNLGGAIAATLVRAGFRSSDTTPSAHPRLRSRAGPASQAGTGSA